ncbi:MAG: hypothetical protein LLG14_19930 [Nocardiaceae bacterium]|nr:hypothetical protein [Nocardiaceae bacterium]
MTAQHRTPNGYFLTLVLPVINQGARFSSQPFANADELVPHTAKFGFSWSHNGVMIPNLPEPLRFLSITTINGTSGAAISDVLHVPPPPGGPRNRATANISTAATPPGFWGDYRIDTDCEFAADGSKWRFGEDLEIVGNYPSFHVTARTDDLAVDLKLSCTNVVTWFIRTPIYTHLSLLTHYDGTIIHDGTTYEVNGQCTFEHAVAVGPYSIINQPIPWSWMRMPLDFFTYQVVDLGDGLQLLFVATEAEGHTALNGAYLRHADGRSIALDKGVEFEVVENQVSAATTPDGAHMPLPLRFRWQTPSDSVLPIVLEGTVDAPFSWGLGNGYVGAFSFTGTVAGSSVNGRAGYIEYIDRRI